MPVWPVIPLLLAGRKMLHVYIVYWRLALATRLVMSAAPDLIVFQRRKMDFMVPYGANLESKATVHLEACTLPWLLLNVYPGVCVGFDV